MRDHAVDRPDVPGDASTTDFAFSAAVPFNLIHYFTITPSVTYTTLLSDVKDIADAAGVESDAVVWGLSAMFSF